MHVAVTGASGLVGKALVASFRQQGSTVSPVFRKPRGIEREILWPDSTQLPPAAAFENLDAVIHLAGEPIAQLWTKEAKDRIYQSRVTGTKHLSEVLASLEKPPRVFICASAIGYYGDKANMPCDENTGKGDLFLSEVVADWESATQLAQNAGIRVVHARFGMILSPEGGALKAMLPAFKMGLAGPLGSGSQWMSWITLPDVLRAIHHCISDETLRGPVNIVAPEPEINALFTKKLAAHLKRPAVLPAPAFVLKLLLNGLAEELLLASTRALPKRLQETGFTFQHPDLETAFSSLLAQ